MVRWLWLVLVAGCATIAGLPDDYRLPEDAGEDAADAGDGG
jgi:hypothetical protein